MNFQPSERTKNLKQSGIRAASFRCNQIGGINLGQGICDLPVPQEIVASTMHHLQRGTNTYSDCQGVLPLREKLAEKISMFNKIPVSPDEIMVGHGSTGVFTCAAMTLFNPGDEVVLFEPFYGYHKNILELMGVTIKSVPMDLNTFQIDFDQLQTAITQKTRGIVVCTPCNPSGKVFTRDELILIGRLAEKHNLVVITDEIYEYITYPGHEHVSLASLEDFKSRTLTLSGFSKTYNMTGWRLGYASGPRDVIARMALVQDYFYVCPVTPLQYGVIAALNMPPSYYKDMAELYLKKRDFVVTSLRELGFELATPQGAYYIMADFSKLGFDGDVAAVNHLIEKAKVATVTGSSFYLAPEDGRHFVRFCYALNEEKLRMALAQISNSLK